DRRHFEYQVALLEAKRVEAVQQVAQLESELSAARAEDVRLVAEEAYARTVHEQEKEIYKQEATTDRKYMEAAQKYKAAQAALERSRAQVRKAEQGLQGSPSGSLPAVGEPKNWIRLAQRFQVRVTPELPPDHPLRVGATASVAVYTRDGYWLNGVTETVQGVEAELEHLR